MEPLTLHRFGPHSGKLPVVSVAMLAFNHAAYIGQAIESVFSQKTDFPIELVIGEDCSRDSTLDDILECCRQAPFPVTVLHSSANVGMHGNLTRVLEHCRGEFRAMLEGDDFWTAPLKLERQLTLLTSRKELSGCFHAVDVLKEPEKVVAPGPAIECRDHDLADLVRSNVVPTCSLVYRASALPQVPGWVASLKMADWPINLLLARTGPLACLPEHMAVYRQHDAGVWSGMRDSGRVDAMVQLYRAVQHELPREQRPLVNERLAELLYHCAIRAKESGMPVTCASAYLQSRWLKFASGRSPLNRHDFSLLAGLLMESVKNSVRQ